MIPIVILKALIAAIRNAETLEELKQLVTPAQEEGERK